MIDSSANMKGPRKPPLLVIGALVILACGAAARPVLARMGGDLNLRDAVANKFLGAPNINNHLRADWCPICHQKKKESTTASLGDDFLSEDYPDFLCYDCHKGWVELHPTRIDPKKSRLKVNVPMNVLPQRFIHEGWYTIVCMTCHDIHFPHDGYKLLRGFSKDPRLQPARFSDRLAFCESCHGQQLEYLTPHKIRNQQTGCTLCHVRKPSGKDKQPLRSNVNVLCTYCHPVSSDPHYLQFNPFPDLDEDVLQKSGVVLRDGAYTCITCHKPHGTSPYIAYLQEEYVNLVRSTVRINPHATGLFCQICHTDPLLTLKSPRMGQTKKLVNDDVNALCSRCHGVGRIKSMSHYLGAPTERVKVPKNLPLSAAGKITCITCHLPGCGPVTADNPKFIRKSSATMKGFCTQCHDWSQLAGRDIHAELLNNRGCEVCHQQPGGTDNNQKPGDLRSDQNFVCMQCHEPDAHPAYKRHIGKPGRIMSVKIDNQIYPLDPFQRVTCNTCHQIHPQTPSRKFLRVSNPDVLCVSCHFGQ